jgi:L-ascorbate metabolism protein UlaG (beta-lactamase superfamily)
MRPPLRAARAVTPAQDGFEPLPPSRDGRRQTVAVMDTTADLALEHATAAGRSVGSVTFIGTATVLLRLGPFTLLTDPNFLHRGESAAIGFGLRTPRLTDPAMEIEALPHLDAVVLSHLHGDHFDQVAERRLPRDLPIVTSRQSALGLRAKGFHEARGLATWQSIVLRRGDARLRITAVPGRHGPRPVALLLPRVIGSVLDLYEGHDHRVRLYVSGDTLVHPGLQDLADRFPDIDLALVHLGGTRLAGVLLTMDATQGVECLRIVRPRTAVPIHYDDYPVFRSPLSDFVSAVADAGLSERVRVVSRGAALDIPARGKAG